MTNELLTLILGALGASGISGAIVAFYQARNSRHQGIQANERDARKDLVQEYQQMIDLLRDDLESERRRSREYHNYIVALLQHINAGKPPPPPPWPVTLDH